MPEEGQKSKLFSKFHHLFSKEETEEVPPKKEVTQPRIGKMVMPDGSVRLPDGTVIEEEPKKKEQLQPEELDIRFATNLVKIGGKFMYCESSEDLVAQLDMLKKQNGWQYVYAWEARIQNLFESTHFQEGVIGFNMQDANAAVSTCENLIADTGDILLSSRQATHRQLPVFPRSHVIITDRTQCVATLEDAINAFAEQHKEELPSLINMSNQPRHNLENQRIPVLESLGPRDIYVFMTDEPLQ